MADDVQIEAKLVAVIEIDVPSTFDETIQKVMCREELSSFIKKLHALQVKLDYANGELDAP